MVKVGVHVVCEDNGLPKGLWCLIRKFFHDFSIHRGIPIMFGVWQVGVVGLVGAEADDCMLHAVQGTAHAFGTVEVPASRSSSETRQGHDGSCHIEASERNGPLERTDERLVLLYSVLVEVPNGALC